MIKHDTGNQLAMRRIVVESDSCTVRQQVEQPRRRPRDIVVPCRKIRNIPNENSGHQNIVSIKILDKLSP